MTASRLNVQRLIAATFCCPLLHGAAFGQTSVNKELDRCITEERVKATAVGALAGGAGGKALQWLDQKFRPNKKPIDSTTAVVVGGAVGATAGLITSNYTAVRTCYQQHPEWIPASEVKRTKSFAATRAELHYEPSQGVVVRAKEVAMPATVRPGDMLDIKGTFQVMTPQDNETPVTIERKLWGIADGQETELPFAGRSVEQRTVEPGEQTSVDHIPVPSSIASGTAFRVDYLISAPGQTPSVASGRVTVR